MGRLIILVVFPSIPCDLHVHYCIIKCKNENVIFSWFYKFKKYYLQNRLYLYGSFHFDIPILQPFLSHEKLLKTHRIFEKTAVLRYSLVTQIKAAGNRDHWNQKGVPLGTATCKRAKWVMYIKISSQHHYLLLTDVGLLEIVTLLAKSIPLNGMKLCHPLLCSLFFFLLESNSKFPLVWPLTPFLSRLFFPLLPSFCQTKITFRRA